MKKFKYLYGTYYFNVLERESGNADCWDNFRINKEDRLSFQKHSNTKNRMFFIILFEKLRKELKRD